ncbi:hypothetical protein OVA24_11825 [Luteolibacter sp. SL250]|nr:hypothetical protein [Luteolibacter sp. SL250]WAC17928.1 hypothetical protein OVA24_11825 [Luteolibacter sp. SL250]
MSYATGAVVAMARMPCCMSGMPITLRKFERAEAEAPALSP